MFCLASPTDAKQTASAKVHHKQDVICNACPMLPFIYEDPGVKCSWNSFLYGAGVSSTKLVRRPTKRR